MEVKESESRLCLKWVIVLAGSSLVVFTFSWLLLNFTELNWADKRRREEQLHNNTTLHPHIWSWEISLEEDPLSKEIQSSLPYHQWFWFDSRARASIPHLTLRVSRTGDHYTSHLLQVRQEQLPVTRCDAKQWSSVREIDIWRRENRNSV